MVGEPRELILCVYQLEATLDDQPAPVVVGTEPSRVSSHGIRRGIQDTSNVFVGFIDESVGNIASGFDPRLLGGCAAAEGSPLVVCHCADSTRQFHSIYRPTRQYLLSNPLSSSSRLSRQITKYQKNTFISRTYDKRLRLILVLVIY